MGNNLPTLSFGTSKIVVSVSASDGHTCVVLSDDAAKCCGLNQYGQLGYGDTTNRYLTAQIGDNLPAVTLGTLTARSVFAGSRAHTTFIFTDGSVKSIGLNADYELGYNDAVNRNFVGDSLPGVSLGSGLIAVSGGCEHGYGACLIFSTQQLKCFGKYMYGYEDTVTRNGANPATMGDELPFIDLGQGVVSVAMDEIPAVACAVL
eukprot:1279720-Amphidinium_carterae.1